MEDNRFKLDKDFFEKILNKHYLKSYDLIKIKLKDIKREWQGRIISLDECHPYKYLNGEKEQYFDYCIENKAFNFQMSEVRFKTLIDSIDKNSFDEKFVPVLDQNDCILDGQHRCCILLNRYGRDYEVLALKLQAY